MRFFYFFAIALAAATMTGCCTVPGGSCGPGMCDDGSQYWDNYCVDGSCGIGGCGTCQRNSGLLDYVFGSSCDSGSCGSGSCGGGCQSCRAGGESYGVAARGPAMAYPQVVGCAGSTCDGRCGGQCPAAQLAWQSAGATTDVTRAALRQVVNTPQRVADRCANGFHHRAPGPTSGAVAYPYYTTRGPRDFLLNNPPSIGP